jgi:hypothetical protein
VEVCDIDDGAPCTTTNAEGGFRLEGLADKPWYLLSMKLAGHQSVMRLAYPHQTLSPTVLLTDGQASGAAASVGATYPDDANGHIMFGAGAFGADPQDLTMVEGFTAALTPPGGLGPFYANTGEVLDPALTAASAAGWGVFYNVPPGDHEIAFAHPAMDCGDPVPVRVVAGFVSTHIAARCR